MTVSGTAAQGESIGAPEGEAEPKRVRGGTSEPGFIMLIEDDFMLRSALDAVLRSEGYRVECAATAVDALRRLERPPLPSLILLDILLPYMDGLQFRALQRDTREIADIPVIVITAVGLKPDVIEELDLRQAFFKPVNRPRLLEAIRQHCSPSVS
jgi:CheY-like chemotaxis protein